MEPDLDRDGFCFEREVLSGDQRLALADALGSMDLAGRRGVLGNAVIVGLASSGAWVGLMSMYCGAPAHPVRAIFFDKSPQTNWLVPWHQDLSIAVMARAEIPGYGPWSVKDGIPHVQPPLEVLERMLTMRIHLDDCDESNGALRVIPGSHRQGRIDAEGIRAIRSERASLVCALRAGDALIMRPLLLHASGRSASEGRRRVLHVEYAASSLPEPLEWHQAELSFTSAIHA